MPKKAPEDHQGSDKKPHPRSLDDITRIEDLAPLDHPALPATPEFLSANFLAPELNDSHISLNHLDASEPIEVEKHREQTDHHKMSAMQETASFEADQVPPQEPVMRPLHPMERSSFSSLAESGVNPKHGDTSVDDQSVENMTQHHMKYPTPFDDDQSSDAENSNKDQTLMHRSMAEHNAQPYFQDVKDELDATIIKQVPMESYPSYSLLLQNIALEKDKREIELILKEFDLFQHEAEKNLITRSLAQGHLLLPRLSEFAAIFLANKFRLLSLQVTLSDAEELSLQSDIDLWDRGVSSPQSWKNSHEEGAIFPALHPSLPTSFIFSSLDFYPHAQIDQSFHPLHITKILSAAELEVLHQYWGTLQENIHDQTDEKINATHKYFLEQLLEEMQKNAINLGANAILKLQWQIIYRATPSQETTILLTGQPVCLTLKR